MRVYIDKNPATNTIINGCFLALSSLHFLPRQGSRLLPVISNSVLNLINSVLKQEKDMQMLNIKQEGTTLSLFAAEIIVYMEIQKNLWINYNKEKFLGSNVSIYLQ